MALGQLIDGQWSTTWSERDNSGQFHRMTTQFHHEIKADGSSPFPAERDRYHLYISLGCPWAHRTALLWKLKGLENAIGLSVVDPAISEQGWQFSDAPGCIRDPLYGADYLWQLYVKAESTYTGRVTVPVLWDKQMQTIVNNESRHIIRMLNAEFNAYATHPELDFYPLELRDRVDRVTDEIYHPINNGVYRTGFASTQTAYEDAVTELFADLNRWEGVLAEQAYVCGDRLTLADWCLFATLFRFDLAYHGVFKCNLKRLVDYPNLWSYTRRLYQYADAKAVCNINHVKQLYYAGLPEINPSRIVPKGPQIDFEAPHNREKLEDRRLELSAS
ncbi:MAG: glutathione S-transferase family protein [Cyanobacteria bacterium P01_F01_bin.33]